MLSYDFGTGDQGWAISTWDEPSNLALHVPSGVTAPRLEHNDGEGGNVDPGVLVLHADFPAAEQYVDVIVERDSVDLSGKTLHARVKLNGALPAGGLQLHATSLPSFAWHGGWVDTASLVPGEWTTLDLDLSAAPPDFDASQIVQLGVKLFAVEPSQGAVELVIDHVTD